VSSEKPKKRKNFFLHEFPFPGRSRRVGFALIIVLGSLALAEANVLQCSYSVRSTWNVVNAYTCVGNIIMTSDSPFITSVSGVHALGRTDADVQVVVIEGQNIRFFPRGLVSFLKRFP
jgi:hypothetical protein